MLLLLTPLDSRLQIHRYIQIYALADVHFHSSTLLPCVYIGLTVVQLKKHMNHMT